MMITNLHPGNEDNDYYDDDEVPSALLASSLPFDELQDAESQPQPQHQQLSSGFGGDDGGDDHERMNHGDNDNNNNGFSLQEEQQIVQEYQALAQEMQGLLQRIQSSRSGSGSGDGSSNRLNLLPASSSSPLSATSTANATDSPFSQALYNPNSPSSNNNSNNNTETRPLNHNMRKLPNMGGAGGGGGGAGNLSGTDPRPRTVGLLPEDSFSFLVTVRWSSKAAMIAVVAVSIQFSVLIFMTMDSIEIQPDIQQRIVPRNWLSVPPTSVIQLTCAQYLALMIASVSQNDCLESVLLLFYGYKEPHIRALIGEDRYQPDYLKLRWFLSIGLRFFVGFFMIIVTFMLVAQSETVRDVMLDFTAVEFISQLDDTAYLLSTFGLFGNDVKRETDCPIYDSSAFQRAHYRNYNSQRRRRRDGTDAKEWEQRWRKKCNAAFEMFLRTLLFWITMALLTYIVVGQYNGRYVPDTLLVQMGDESDPLLATYSGLYNLNLPHTGVFEYVEHGDGYGLLKWCDPINAWVFVDKTDARGSDCATIWRIKSTALDQFGDILSVADEPWYVFEQNNIKLEADHVRVVSMMGVQTNCDPGFYGWTCTFDDTCDEIGIDRNTGPFQNRRTWPASFTRLANTTVYNRPVYYNRENEESNADLVMFIGRRWAMLSTSNWTEDTDEDIFIGNEELLNMLDNFRVYKFRSDLGVAFLSELVDVGTPTNRGSPIGLQWYATEASDDLVPEINQRISVPNVFFCAICNGSDRRCLYGAPCIDGTCVCDGDNLGFRCEVIPANNGFCNPNFNRRSFDFDGGDCCPLTCLDTPQFTCLKSKNEFIDYGSSRCRNKRSNYGRKLPQEVPDYMGAWMNSITVAPGISLTQDGHTYALSYRVVDETSLGSMVGYDWIDWGVSHEFGGFYNEISSLFPGSIGGPVRRLPVKGLAASYLTRRIIPYVCDGSGCLSGLIEGNTSRVNAVVPSNFSLKDYWHPFSLSRDGQVLAHGAVYPEGAEFYTDVSMFNTSDLVNYRVDLFVQESNYDWAYSNHTIDLTINRTEVVETELVEVPCINATGLSLYTFLDLANISITELLQDVNATASDIVASSGFDLDEVLNRTNSEPSINNETNVTVNKGPIEDMSATATELLQFLEITGYSFDAFLTISDFDEDNYGILMCRSQPVFQEVNVYQEVTYTTEAPIYLSLSGLRSDGTRRLAVGSILFSNRSPSELSGPLATRVFEIANDGRVLRQGPNVPVIEMSDRHGKSSIDAIGIPKKSVAISNNGNVLVTGSLYFDTNENGHIYEKGIVKVFEWENDDWRLRQDLVLGRNDTEPAVSSGWSNTLSADGSILAVAFPLRSSIYRWNGTAYSLQSPEIPFAAGTDVDVSFDGSIVGFAAPLRGGFGSFVYINEMAPWCNADENHLRLSYTPKTKQSFYGRIVSAAGLIIAEAGWTADEMDAADRSFSQRVISESVLRPYQLEVETDSPLDDPTGLTFAYDICIKQTVCPDFYWENTVSDLDNLGVVFKGFLFSNQTTPTSGESCFLDMDVVEAEG